MQSAFVQFTDSSFENFSQIPDSSFELKIFFSYVDTMSIPISPITNVCHGVYQNLSKCSYNSAIDTTHTITQSMDRTTKLSLNKSNLSAPITNSYTKQIHSIKIHSIKNHFITPYVILCIVHYINRLQIVHYFQTTNSTLFSPEYDDDNKSSDYYTNGTVPSHAHTYHPNNNNNPFHVHIRPPPPSSVHNNHRYNKNNYNANDIYQIEALQQNPLVSRVLEIFDDAEEKKAKIDFAFRIYDVNNDGYISNGDLFRILKIMVGDNLNDTQLQQLVDRTILQADKDKDGKLSVGEFTNVNSISIYSLAYSHIYIYIYISHSSLLDLILSPN